MSPISLASISRIVLLNLIVIPIASLASAGQLKGTEVTFTKDIAPLLQRSCQNCHRPNSVAPMSLIAYEEVRPWARSIKQRTGLRNRMGVMPPWFIEKDIGIQDFKDDISLSDDEIALIAEWVDTGAPRGDLAEMPSPLMFAEADEWDFDTPDLIINSPPVTMAATAPDWWGALAPTPTGLTEDRYVSAMQVKEISDVRGGTGGKFIFHHATMSSISNGSSGGNWPAHEVGRNAEVFDPEVGRLLQADAQFAFPSVHMHANGEDTTAQLRVAFKFHPKGYSPTRQRGGVTFGNGELDLKGMQSGQQVHIYATVREHTKLTTFEPHMHASGVRMCLEAIWGGRTETLNCAGYDHNWVKVYKYGKNAAPLLPKGTILHVTAYFDNTTSNPNVVDPRNWGGLGHRSIDNMAILFSPGITLSEKDFRNEMTERRKSLNLADGDTVIGCPLCGFNELPQQVQGQQ